MSQTLRLFGFSCAFIFGLSAALQAQITFTWNFEGGTPQQGSSSNNAVATAGLAANGTGLSNASYTALGNGGGQGFTANEWATAGLDINDYIEFSFSTLSCRTVTITTLNLDADREYNNASNNAPATLSLRSSLNNYATSLGTISTATTDTWASHSITGLSVLVPQNTTIFFRIYGYAAGNAQRYLSFDNVVFTGTFTNTAPSASPMPASATTCVGNSVAFNGTPSGGSGIYSTHTWTVQNAGSTGATNANLSNANTQTVTFNTGGLTAGTAVLRYTVTDNLGCIGTADVTVTLEPIVPPTFSSMPPNLTISCPAAPPLGTMLSYSNGQPGACLISGSATGVITGTHNACGGSYTETWTASGNFGTITTSRTITVTAAPLPTMTAPANITVACGSIPASSTLPYTNGEQSGCLLSGNSNGSTFTSLPGACGGTVTETWTATDACSRALAAVSRTITVSPAALPTMTAPANITVDCGAIPASSTIAYTNGLGDGCLLSGNSNGSTFTPTPGVCGGTVTETWTATDACSRALAAVSRTITVSPAALPTMTAPANITVDCGAIPTSSTIAYTNGLAAGCLLSGNSNGSTFTPTPGVCGGTVTETWTATDACSRALAAVSRTITVSPAALPTMTAPANITVDCGAIPASSTIAYTNGLAAGCLLSGNSNGSTFTPLPGACGGTVTETWTATDACSRALAAVSRTITVSPAALPTMTAPANITVACGAIPASSTIAYTNGLSTGCLLSGNSNGSTFSPTPNECGGTVTETWTATDACSRALAAVSRTITVSPAALPTMTAPANITVACGGIPASSTIAYSNGLGAGCLLSGNSNGSTFTPTPGVCGGTVTETWTATDACSRALAPVSRTITVSPAALPTMTAPANITVDCGAIPASNTIAYTNGLGAGCLLSGNSNGSTFTPTPGVCGGTVTETWTATDACSRALAAVSRTITVSPAALPTMTAPANITVACGGIPASSTIAYTNGLSAGCLLSGNSNGSSFTPTPGVCGGTVTETWTASDACSRALAPVSRTITVSPAPQAAFDAVSNTSVLCTAAPPVGSMLSYDNGQMGACQIKGAVLGVISGTYTNCSSVFTESWTVTDACGRTSTQSRNISVSAVPLTIICPADEIQSGCQTEGQIGAAFNAWRNSFSPVGGCGTTATDLSALTPPPTGGSLTVTYTASDICGQVQTCTKSFSVTTCIGISGKIFWEGTRLTTMTGVNGVTVNLSGDDTGSNVTGLPGTYLLSPTMGTNFMITPVKNRPMPHAINGLTAADASRIQKHLLGFLITDVYKLIAADANKSNSITVDDAYLIQNALLGNPMAQSWFANNTWRFVPKAYVFPNLGNPWGFPEKININTMTDPLGNNDFIGMKVGDVNSSANPVNAPNEQGPELVWKIQDQVLEPGKMVTVTFNAHNFANLSAMQFGLQFDPDKIQFQQIETLAGNPFQVENFGLFNVENGEIRLFLSLPQSATLANGTTCFRIQFQSLQSNIKLSEVLSLNSALIPAEAYTNDFTPVNIQLAFESLSTKAFEPNGQRFRLEQNLPNPFSKSTVIGFYLPEACLAQLRVFDIDGRLVKEEKGWFEMGHHQYTFQSEDFSGDGMLYYELITPFGTQSRKMLRNGH
jgi:sarcosine oxidase delta subunit